MPFNHPGNAQPAIDKEEHAHPFGESGFGAKHVVEPLPPGFYTQKLLDYVGRTDDNPVYVAFGPKDASTSDTNWVIQKLTYDASDRVTQVQVANGAWDSRGGLF